MAERAIAGVTRGIVGPGQSVRWRGRHFGLSLQHESVISGYEFPRFFQDRMTDGVFREFIHDDSFEPVADGTLMRDALRFSAPLGWLGALAERLVLRRHMECFLRERNGALRSTAEGDESGWRVFLAADRI